MNMMCTYEFINVIYIYRYIDIYVYDVSWYTVIICLQLIHLPKFHDWILNVPGSSRCKSRIKNHDIDVLREPLQWDPPKTKQAIYLFYPAIYLSIHSILFDSIRFNFNLYNPIFQFL